MVNPKRYWPHDETCCGRDIAIGTRFERDVLDYATGLTSPWNCTVVSADPVDFTRIFCRRVTVIGDDGRKSRPFVQDLFSSRYKAIDNVVSIAGRAALNEEAGK